MKPIDLSINATVNNSNNLNQNKVRVDNYILFKDTSQLIEQSEDVDLSIDSYINLISQNDFTDALNFWKCY